mmetsp:Transcript_24926/g.53761  ORF Transcript_24926/g.53761 Transcript_24926/m.53761 type:complete len:228 (+) Transcript_24926:574-1257(+)
MTPDAPSSHLTTNAPSSSKLSITKPSPLKTREDLPEICTADGFGNFFLNSLAHAAKLGFRTQSGPDPISIPLNVTFVPSCTLHPRERSISQTALLWSASPEAADPDDVPFACNATPSAVAFFTGEKHSSLAKLVNPTFSASDPLRTVGKSCIMHSSRVGFLNMVFSASLYLGFTNSGMTPFVRWRTCTYDSRLKSNWLMLPGKGEKPVLSSFTSPLSCPVARRRGSN